jgi:hypothetical protein
MKIWYGYGSEHSMNLVMIGQFENVHDAAKAKQLIDWLTEKVRGEIDAGAMTMGEPHQRFGNGWLDFLGKLKVYYLGLIELEQFAYDVRVEIEDNRVILTTDESDVSAFLKVLLNEGGRVEVYSAHNYPETGYGRGSKAAKASA